MTKKGIQESNFIFSKDRTSKFVAHKTRMPIEIGICFCDSFFFQIALFLDKENMDTYDSTRFAKVRVFGEKEQMHKSMNLFGQ